MLYLTVLVCAIKDLSNFGVRFRVFGPVFRVKGLVPQ